MANHLSVIRLELPISLTPLQLRFYAKREQEKWNNKAMK